MIAAGQNDTPATAAVAEDLVLHRILQQFEGRAATYDANNTYHPALAQNLLQLLALKPGDRLLDLAAGTGIVALAAAAAVAPGGNVVLVDISPAMLQQARSKYTAAVQLGDSNVESSTAQCAIQRQDTGEREQQLLSQRQQQQQQQLAPAHFILGDIEQLHSCLPAEWLHSFSAITCSAAVPFLQQPTAALASWRHWLQQPGGKLAFNAFVPPAIEDYGTFIRLAGECAFPAEFDPSEVLGSTERVTAALTEAGYSRIQVTPEAKERWMPAASPEAHAAAIWNMALHRNVFRGPEQLQQQPQQLQALQDAYMAAVVEDVVASGRWDATGQRVLSRFTVLHVLAMA